MVVPRVSSPLTRFILVLLALARTARRIVGLVSSGRPMCYRVLAPCMYIRYPQHSPIRRGWF
jgi:hypothetical protein